MLIELLKNDLQKNAKKEKSKIYFTSSEKYFKIGQTAQRYMCDRMKTLRLKENDIKCLGYVEFTGSKALRDFVESALRLYIENQDYILVGNDHFVKKGKETIFKKHCINIVTDTLNSLEIDYKIVNKKIKNIK